MIELTQEQMEAISASGEAPTRVLHPRNKARYVLISEEVYDRLAQETYDDGPWTDEERDRLAAEVDAMLDDDMAVEDAAP